ncbi:MAG: glycosyltransferase family 4 protein [Fibromonadaceae bacterium]|jgi:glycosyltransferase involved in cell wall biosynthesis|nr:glycosyltransferase family 4 protein [Fibromonadaceae bacterium]
MRNILVDAYVFDCGFEGTATYIYGLYTSLINNENVAVTFCASKHENLRFYFPQANVRFIKPKFKSRILQMLLGYTLQIKKGNYDFAHFQYYVPPIKKSRYIVTIHDILFIHFKKYFPIFKRNIYKFLFQYSAKKSNIVLTDSLYSKKCISKEFSIAENRINIIPLAAKEIPAINIDIKKKYDIRNYIHFVSRFERRKNHISLLKAYIKLELYKNYDIVFIGNHKSGDEFKCYKELLKIIPKNISQHVHFLQDIDNAELNAFYQQSACFVYPSFAEGFGIPPLEAGVNDCKVLCSNQTAMEDFNFFKHQFNPNNPGELEQKLMKIIEDENYPFEEIKQSILKKYNWDKIAKDFINILENAWE